MKRLPREIFTPKRKVFDVPGAMGQRTQTGEEKTVLAPRRTLTSELTWSQGLMPAYYRKRAHVSPRASWPCPPQSLPGTQHTATRSPLKAGRKVFHAHMVLLSAPRSPHFQPSTMPFLQAVPLSAASVYHLPFFFSLSIQHNKDSQCLWSSSRGQAQCKAWRWLDLLSGSFHRGGD